MIAFWPVCCPSWEELWVLGRAQPRSEVPEIDVEKFCRLARQGIIQGFPIFDLFSRYDEVDGTVRGAGSLDVIVDVQSYEVPQPHGRHEQDLRVGTLHAWQWLTHLPLLP